MNAWRTCKCRFFDVSADSLLGVSRPMKLSPGCLYSVVYLSVHRFGSCYLWSSAVLPRQLSAKSRWSVQKITRKLQYSINRLISVSKLERHCNHHIMYLYTPFCSFSKTFFLSNFLMAFLLLFALEQAGKIVLLFLLQLIDQSKSLVGHDWILSYVYRWIALVTVKARAVTRPLGQVTFKVNRSN